MSFQPFDRNPSGIVFFGADATDQVFESNSNFTIDGTSLVATNIKISDGGNIGSASDADAISIAAGGNVTMTQDLTVTGDLTVNGTTTTVSTTNTVVSDLLLELGNGTTGSAANDAGIVIERGDDDNAFIGFDESANKFTMGTGSFTGASTGDLTISAGTLVANLEGNVTGNVTGSADTLTTARDFTLTGQVTSDSAVSFDGSANAAIAVSIDKTAVTDQTTITSIADGDLVLIADVSDSNNLKKITKANFVSALGGGTMSSFNITDGSTSQQIDNGEDITFADGTGAEFVVSATNTVTVNSVDSEIDHASLSNFVANEHIDHSSVTITAGNGLTGGGTIAATRTFAVGAGTGITVNANDVQITDGGVGTTQLAADAVTGAKIADDAIDSEHYVDGSIDTAHIGNLQVTTAKIAADAITGAKIADDAIDSEHYTDGSIDAAHIASSAVTEAKRSRTVATANSTSTISNDITLATAGASGITLTLPAAATGKVVTVKKVDTGAGNVTLDPPGSVTIDGAATKVLYHQYETMTCVSDGTNWFIV